MKHLTDAELNAAIEYALSMAHDAEKNPMRKDHDGHVWVEQHHNGWARWSHEWCALCAERDRRAKEALGGAVK